MYVEDLTGNQYPLQATSTNNYELNGNQDLALKIIPTKANKLFINEIDLLWKIIDLDGVKHAITYCKKRGEGDSLTVEIRAVPKFFDDFNTQRIYERYDESMTDNECFNLIFNGSGYNYILVGTFSSVVWEGFGEGATRLELFKNAINRYNAEFYITGNTVYLDNLIGRDTQFMYRYKLNASDIVQENDGTEYWTYAKGYGNFSDADGWEKAKLVREYTSPLASILGKREAPPIMNGNIKVTSTMDSQLKTLVDDSLKISVSAHLHDLRRQGYPLGQPQLGDRTFLIDERIKLDTEVRVVNLSFVRNWKGEVIDLQATFGSQNLTKRYQSNLQTAVNNINNLLDGKVKLPFSVYDARMQEAINAMSDVLTELSVADDGSLRAIDKEDQNNMVILNANGLFISDDGGATPKQAIWGGGINASVITTGSMLADRIAGGILQSLNDNLYFNLNTGFMKLENTTFELGGSAEIEFIDSRNKIAYQHFDPTDNMTRTAGIGMTTSINDRFPVVFMGTTGTSKANFSAVDESFFSGFIANTTKRESTDGIGNSAVGYTFHVRDKAVSFNKGFTFDLNGETLEFKPINGGTYRYYIGANDNQFEVAYIQSLRSGAGWVDVQNSSDEFLGQGWRLETVYGPEQHMSLYGLNAFDGGNYYNLGRPDRRFRYVYLTYQPDVASDERLKQDIVDNDLGLSFINGVDTKKFRLKGERPEPLQYGIVAQQLRETLLSHNVNLEEINLLSCDSNGMFSVQYTQLIMPLIKSVQELSQRLEVLENGTVGPA